MARTTTTASPVRGAFAAALVGVLCLSIAACGSESTDSSNDGSRSTGTAAETTPRSGSDAERRFPAQVAENFVRSCTLNAEATSAGKLSHDQASDVCTGMLACLDERMTLAEFLETEQRMQTGEVNPGARVLRRCQQRAVEQLSG